MTRKFTLLGLLALLANLVFAQAPQQQVAQGEYFWDTDPGAGNGISFAALDGNLDETVEALLANAVVIPASPGGHSFNVRVKDIDNNWSPVFTLVVYRGFNTSGVRDIKVVQAEYFWDTDPGHGSGTPILAADGALDETVETVLQNGVNFPSAVGPHTFNLRVKDFNNDWSTVFTTIVHRDTLDPGTRDMKVVQGEYFWDTDPGQGNGNTFLSLDGSFDETVEALQSSGIAMPGGYGGHTFNVRVQDEDNVWSDVFTNVVFADTITPPAQIREHRVVTAEYFWDTDPGQGNGTSVSVQDGAYDETVEALLQSGIATPAALGPHSFNLRVQDTENVWSDLHTTIVYVDSLANPASRQIRLVQAEYFWDTDPGQGNGTAILAQDGTLDETVEGLLGNGISIPAPIGPHVFYVRVKDPLNNWSDPFGTVVYADTNGTGTRQLQVTEAEYFWDTDPGQGNGSPLLAFDGNFNESVEGLSLSGASFPTGSLHTFNVRVRDADNAWSPVFTTVISSGENLFVSDSITGPKAFCGDVPGTVQTYSIDTVGLGTNTYTWNANGGIITNGQGSDQVSVLWQSGSGPYQIWVESCSQTSCDTLFLDVIVHPLPPAFAGNDTSICPGDTLFLQASGGVAYYWAPNTGLSADDIPNPFAIPLGTIDYVVTVTDTNGCVNTDTISVEVFPNTPANAGNDTTICEGDTAQLMASGGISYSWSPVIHLSNPSISNPFATPDITTDFSVLVTDTNGCFATDIVRVTVDFGPPLNAGNDVSICLGDSVQLNATSGLTTYDWSDGLTLSDSAIHNPLAGPIADTEYFLFATNSFGCQSVDSVNVNVFPLPPVDAGADTFSCYNIPIQLQASGANSYQWTPAGVFNNPNLSNPTATLTDTTWLFVTGTDGNTCQEKDSVLVIVQPLPPANAGPDTVVCAGDSIQLQATGGIQYSWTPTALLSDPNISNPFATPNLSLDFVVTVTDTNGCIATDTVFVALEICDTGQVRNLAMAEYFWDTDPGQGNGTPMQAVDGNLGETVEALFRNGITMPITTGPHTFNVRVQDADGTWSPIFTTLVERQPRTDFTRAMDVQQAEYFWDTDPGQGNGSPLLALDGNLDELVESVYANGISLPVTTGGHTFNVRVLDSVGTWSPIFTMVVERRPLTGFVRDLSLIEAEYFWDTDPGQGNGTPMLAQDGAFDEIIESVFANNIPMPSTSGAHLFNVRIRDNDSTWSDVFTTVVVADTVDTLTRDLQLVEAEYFWDTDPGPGNGNPMLAADGAYDEIVEAVIASGINMPAVQGAHTFNVRVREIDNNWSPLFTTIVYHDSITVGNRDLQLVEAEYFWDTDPGQGNATPILAADGSMDEIVESLLKTNFNMPAVQGGHTFNLRVKEIDNNWSDLFTTVVVHDSITVGTRDLQIVEAEYFWDTDPGQGNGTALLAVDGTLDEIVEGLVKSGVNMPPVVGGHTFNVRVREIDNNWSDVFTTVVVHDSITVGTRDLQVVEAEYFWDTDPGQGNGTPLLALDGNLDGIVEGLIRNAIAAPSAQGAHIFSVRVRDFDNNWSKVFSTVVHLDTNSVGTRDVNLVQAEYFWDTDPGQGNGTGLFARDGSIDEAVEELFRVIDIRTLSNSVHSFNVRVQDVNGSWSPVFTTMVSVELPDLFPADTIIGPVAFCDEVPATNVTYSADTIGTWTYTWSVTGGAIQTGQGSDAIEVLWTPGSAPYSVQLEGCAGTYCDTLNLDVVVNPLPVANAGPDTTGCLGTAVQIFGSGGIQYSWIPTSGLSNAGAYNPFATPSDITEYVLEVTDANGCTDTDTMTFTVLPLPPANAGNDTMICVGDTATLYGSGGIAYSWTPTAVVGSPNNRVTTAFAPVDVTFILEVTDTNGCKETDEVIVFIDSVPPVIICPNDTVVPTDSGLCSAVVSYATPAGTDNCQTPFTQLTSGLASGSAFPKGTTSQTFLTTDANGNQDSCSFTVTVNDTEFPVFACPQDTTLNTDPGQCHALFTYSVPAATDNCPGMSVARIGGLASGSNFPKGTTQVTHRATDASGNQTLCAFVVTVIDNEPPSITCSPNIVANNESDSCSAPVSYSLPGISDNCPGVSRSLIAGLPSGSDFPVGTTLQTWVATDAAGNTDSCSFTITVNDVQLPEIICPPNLVVNNDSGICGALVNFTPPIGTDNCPGVFTIQNQGLGNGVQFPVGVTLEQYVATDAFGNQDSCSFTVTVEDVEAPSITCPSNIVLPNDPDSCGATLSYALPVFSDNCPGSTLNLLGGYNSGEHFPVGSTNVTWEVVDPSLNRDTCSFNVNIIDSTPPVVTCPNDTVISNDQGNCDALFNYTVIAFDNCPRDSLVRTSGLPSGSIFPVGTTVNSFKLIDASNNVDSCSFTVTVQDTALPEITCPANIVVTNAPGLCGRIVAYTAPVGTDNCSGATTTLVTGGGAGNFFPVGTTLETYVVTDNVGNSDTCTFTVTVNDTENPQINCQSNITTAIDSGQCDAVVTYPVPVGVDNCPGAVTVRTTGLGSGATFPIGTTTETYQVTDASGNVTTCSLNITVVDTIFPTISCPGDTVLDNDPGVCGALYSYTTPVGQDNCTGHSTGLTQGLASGSTFPVGTTTVTYTVVDISGNTASCSFQVTVNDTQPPVVSCPIDYTAPTTAGQCGATYSYPTPGVSDNCGGASLVQTNGLGSGSFFPVGVTLNSFVVTDASGLTDSCSFTVTIFDGQNPAITCPPNISVFNDPGICGATVNYTPPVGSDNCSGSTTVLTSGLGTGSTFPVGVTTETYTVSDTSGNSASCSFTVTVTDNENPAIVCPADTTIPADSGTCTALFSYVPPVGSDNCPGAVTTQIAGLGSGSNFPNGNTTETFRVTDGVGRTATCSFVITVTDDEAPTITCPANLVVTNDPGQCGANVNYNPPVGTDNCPGASTSRISGIGPGGFFSVGTSLVTYRVVDVSGNADTCSFTVTVNDSEGPQANCPANIVVANDAGQCDAVVNYSVSATDNCSGATTALVSGQVSGSTFALGTNLVTYEAIDATGLRDTCSFTITVEDQEAPSITCSPNIVQLSDTGVCGAVVGYIPPSASDNCSSVSISLTGGLPAGSVFPVDTTLVTFTATDSAGNTNSCSFTVIVTDFEYPVLVCRNDTVMDNDSGVCGAVLNYVPPVGTDNCPGTVTTQIAGLGTGATFPIGTTTETYRAVDPAGNPSQCSFTITVNDNELPVANCPADIVRNNDAGVCGAVVNYTVPFSDNCPSPTLTQTNGFLSGTIFPVGTTLNVFLVEDIHGNIDSCSFTVTVNDTAPPTVVCPPNITVNNDPGICGAVVNYPVNIIDNCQNDTLTLVHLDGLGNGATFPVGTTLESFMAIDSTGNTDTCYFTVTVLDTSDPVIVCPGDTTIYSDSVSCGATFTYALPFTADNCADSGTPDSLLGLGGIAISGYASDNPDAFSFVLLEPVAAGTEILFTDNGWLQTGGFRSGEGTVTWTATSNLPAGTQVAISGGAATIGTATATGGFSLSASGDQLIAFQGSLANPALISGIQMNGIWESDATSANTSAKPAPFIDGVTSLSINPEQDNGTYDCSVLNGTAAQLRAAIHNVNNWTTSNSTVALSSCSFVVSPNVFTPVQITGLGSGSTFPVGNTTETWVVTDSSGNSDTCSFVVTVVDTITPAIVCPGDTILPNDSGICGAVFNFVPPVGADNCPGSATSQTGGLASGAVFPVGTTVQTFEVTDGFLNTASCSFLVSVQDQEAPVARCKDHTVYLDANGNGSHSVADQDDGSSDNCAITISSLSRSTWVCVDVGSHVVTLSVSDAVGNSDSCTSVITVVDTVAPVAVCNNFTVYLPADGDTVIVDSLFNGGTTDGCGIDSVVVAQQYFDCSDIGTNNILTTYFDGNGNQASCTSVVTVLDSIAPVAVCQDVTLALDSLGTATLTASQIDNGSFDNCPVTLSASQTSFTCANIGVQAVTLTVSDISGNNSNCIANVTIEDTLPPVAVCADISVALDGNGVAVISGTMVDGGSTDNCASLNFAVQPDSFTCANLGINPVTLTVTDASGSSDSCTANITVEDTLPPVAVCRDLTVSLDNNGLAVLSAGQIDNGSADNCSIASLSINPDTLDCQNIGANTVVLTVTDLSGNLATCSSTVTVEDTLPPVAVCRDLTVSLDNNGLAVLSTGQIDNGSADNCSISTLSLNPDTLDCQDIGANTVVLTVTDLSGNLATCSSTVTVEDTLPPVAVCRDLTVSLDNNGLAVFFAGQIDNGSADNCSIASLSINRDTLDCQDIGANTVVLTVTDLSGNLATCSSTVTLEDTLPPVAVCRDLTVTVPVAGFVELVADSLDSGSFDNCGIASFVATDDTFFCADAGLQIVTLTVTDVNGNTATCQSNVLVIDQCCNLQVMLDSVRNVSCAGGSDGMAWISTTGQQGPVTYNWSNGDTTEDLSNIPAGTYTLIASDGPNCSDTMQITIGTNSDVDPPLAVCADVSVQLDGAGNATITGAMLDGGSTDNCGPLSFMAQPDSFSCADLGVNLVQLTVFDGAGNSDSCTANVTIEDTLPPVALCQDITVSLDANGQAILSAGLIDNGSTDNCGIAGLSLSTDTLDCQNTGTNPVVLTATDFSGNSATCSATITVEDTLPPVAVCQSFTLALDSLGIGTLLPANIDGGSTDNCSIASFSVSNSGFGCGDVGSQNVTLIVADNSGNSSSCQATVLVVDQIAPVARCRDTVLILNGSGNATLLPQAIDGGSSDACGVASLFATPLNFNCSDVGTNPVTLFVSDVNGNSSSCQAIVSVSDTVPPLAVCQDLTVSLDSAGQALIAPSMVDNGSSDQCTASPTLSLSQSVFGCADIGTQTTTLSVTDAGGNTSTCVANITIADSLPPVAICQDVTVSLDSGGTGSITALQVDGGSSDNCGIVSQFLDRYDFDCTDAGLNTVYLTVVDASGDSSQCTAQVTVQDSIPAAAVCRDIEIFLDDFGSGTLNPDTLYAGAADNCQPLAFAASQTSFSCQDMGVNQVVLTVTDSSGQSSTCISQVTVVPAFCQNDTTLYTDATCQALTPNFALIASQNICSKIIGIGELFGGESALHSMVVDADSAAFVWGRNYENQLGISGLTRSYVPVQMGVDSNWMALAPAKNWSLGLKHDGTLWAWGAYKFGKLGLPVSSDVPQPTQVGTDTIWSQISAGGYHSVALKADGSLWTWGRGDRGQLGNGGTTDVLAPTQLTGSTDWTAISAGEFHTLALKQNGTLWAWGYNAAGQLGDSTNATSLVPKQVGTDQDWVDISSGYDHSAAVKSDGTVWTWGGNASGQLGDGTQTARNHPAEEGSQSGNWEAINSGQFFTSGLKQDGTIWTWGENNYGQVGDGTRTDRLLPVQESTQDSGWVDLATGAAHTLALRGDGKMYAWGMNIYGQIGHGRTNNRQLVPSPVIDHMNMGPKVIDSLVITQTPPKGTPLGPGTHTIQLNANSLSGISFSCSFTVTVEDSTPPEVINCPNDTTVFATVTDPDPAVFWTPPTGTDNCSSVSVSGSHAPGTEFPVGTHPVVYTLSDTSGNTSVCTFNITVVPASQLPVVINDSTYACGYGISCHGAADGHLTVDILGGSPPYTVVWSDAGSGLVRSNLGPGTYQVTVTDSGGVTGSDSVTIVEPSPLVIDTLLATTATGGFSVHCFGDKTASINLAVSGGADCQPYSFNWTGPNGFSSTQEDLNSLGAGQYVLTVSDLNGCSLSDTITLTEPAPLEIDSVVVGDVNCNMAGTLTVLANGGTGSNLYLISGTTVLQDTGNYFSSLPSGVYYVVIQDTNGGCQSAPDTVEIDYVGLISPTTSINTTGPGLNDGSISFSAPTGGVPPFTYSIDNGGTYQSGNVFSGLAPGIYVVSAQDSNGCKTLYAQDTIFGVLGLSFNTVDESCPGEADGSAVVSVTGGTQPYSYIWSNGGTTDSISGLVTGSYIVSVTDASGLYFASGTANVGGPVPISFSYSSTDETSAGANDGTITFSGVSGGTAPYSYGIQQQSWPSPLVQSSPVFTGLVPGDYYLGVFDATGCVNPPPYPLVNIAAGPSLKQEEEGSMLAADGILLEAYPNPFRESTTIRFRMAKDAQVWMEVFTPNGVRVDGLFEGQVNAGEVYTVEFRPEGISNGVYMLRMRTAGGLVKHYKLVLIR